MSAPGLASPFCLWRLQELPCVSGVFAYHEHVSHAWVYKMKYVTITTWKTRALVESTASLLPEPFCSFKWACWLQLPNSTMLAQKTPGRFFSSKKPANSLTPPAGGTGELPAACVGKEPSSPSWPCSVVAQLSWGKALIDFCFCSSLRAGFSH